MRPRAMAAHQMTPQAATLRMKERESGGSPCLRASLESTRPTAMSTAESRASATPRLRLRGGTCTAWHVPALADDDRHDAERGRKQAADPLQAQMLVQEDRAEQGRAAGVERMADEGRADSDQQHAAVYAQVAEHQPEQPGQGRDSHGSGGQAVNSPASRQATPSTSEASGWRIMMKLKTPT